MAVEDPERGGKINGGGGGGGAYASHNSGYTTSSGYALADDDDRHWTSWLIPVVVLLNIAVFVVVMYVNNCPKHATVGFDGHGRCVTRFLGRFSFQPTEENPLFGPSYSTLKKMGALDWWSVVHRHQEWRLVTCIWLHAGIIHLLASMLSLIFVGIRLEQQFGFVKVGIIYMASGFGGSVLSSLFIQKSISVGASGALFGLLGAMLAELITNWTIYTNKAAALFTLLFIIAINLAVGIFPHVNNLAHIGGFVTGLLLGFVLLPRPHLGWLTGQSLPNGVRVKSKYKAYQILLWVISLVLVIAGFAVGLVMLLRGKNGYESCHWCRYLNCVPTSQWKCDR